MNIFEVNIQAYEGDRFQVSILVTPLLSVELQLS